MPNCPFCKRHVPVGTADCPHCRAPVTGMVPQPSGDLDQRVRVFLNQGQKIEAIKVYREETGVGLAEAKEAVEAIQRGTSSAVREKPDVRGIEEELLQLLSERKKIQAIKVYRERMGGGLKEAKDAVEALGGRHGIVDRGGGCLGVMLALLAIITVMTVWP